MINFISFLSEYSNFYLGAKSCFNITDLLNMFEYITQGISYFEGRKAENKNDFECKHYKIGT